MLHMPYPPFCPKISTQSRHHVQHLFNIHAGILNSNGLLTSAWHRNKCKAFSWDVSENSGTLKSSMFNRAFHYKPPFLGYHYFWNTYLDVCQNLGIQSPDPFLAVILKSYCLYQDISWLRHEQNPQILLVFVSSVNKLENPETSEIHKIKYSTLL